MKRLLSYLLALSLLGCGGSDTPSFTAVWDGAYTGLDNGCPFSLVEPLPGLFPMTVTEDADGVFTVVAADGSVAVGGQGQGEEISFLATSANFGDYGSILPYVCLSTSTVRFLTAGDSESKISVVVSFSNCAAPEGFEQESDCEAVYRWDGTKR